MREHRVFCFMKQVDFFDKIISLAKRRGFVFQTSEIYGGLANSYDYGPNGVELMRNIREQWWKYFVSSRMDMVGLDSQVILHPKTWEASGHVDSFTEPMVEDIVTNKRYRADHLVEDFIQDKEQFKDMVVEEFNTNQLAAFITENNIKSPDGNELSEPKEFNTLFESAIGSIAGEKSKIYLRGETAQGIFTNFKNVLDSSRMQLPFGIAQTGKSFRNEITTGQFIFRTFEFEQAEIEYFFDPSKDDWEKLFNDWKDKMWDFVTTLLGVQENNLRWRQHTDTERSHYSKETYDLDYNFPFGFKELWGIAYRTDYDLKQHMEYSQQKLQYTDPTTQEKIIPHVIEPAVGLNRIFFMLLCDAYFEDTENQRVVLKLKPLLAPNQVAVFPLVKNKPELVAKAQEIYSTLSKVYRTAWDDRGNIGKRYYAQDEIGTPYCVTIDYDTLDDSTVTVRDRDTMEQARIKTEDLAQYFSQKIA